jgi:MoxR-like ATPase
VDAADPLDPVDVGTLAVFNQHEAWFDFRPGPVFANLVLVDEINRAPPKTLPGLLDSGGPRRSTPS